MTITTTNGIDESQTIQQVWLYSDAQASMDRAIEVALNVSNAHGASLTLLTVVEAPDDSFAQTPLGQDLIGLVREDKKQRLEQLEDRARRELPRDHVTSVILEGQAAWYTLTSHALTSPPDLLIVPADGGASAGPFGTFSQHLFRKWPAPVWSIQAGTAPLPKRALLAVDSGSGGTDKRLLSQEILRFALGLAAHTEMELHLGHAWSLFDESLIAGRFGAEATKPYVDLQMRIARDFTEQLLQRAGFRDGITAVHYPKGEAGVAIPSLAEEIGADVVILGSAARRGLKGFFMGSVAETILSRLKCSALVVKPPDFISPVRAR